MAELNPKTVEETGFKELQLCYGKPVDQINGKVVFQATALTVKGRKEPRLYTYNINARASMTASVEASLKNWPADGWILIFNKEQEEDSGRAYYCIGRVRDVRGAVRKAGSGAIWKNFISICGDRMAVFRMETADGSSVPRRITGENESGESLKDYLYHFFYENTSPLTENTSPLTENTSPLTQEIVDLAKNGARQIICHGAPGTGKTWSVSLLKWASIGTSPVIFRREKAFVQFHPSYDYTDFVEGLRPAVVGDEAGEMTFVRMDGIFKAFCRWVVEQNRQENNAAALPCYLFFIDEINRADLSKVFGELMYCLEEGYRGEENRIQTQYHGLPTYQMKDGSSGAAVRLEQDVFRNGFYIPENVMIVGTMNDIDRSVESFDFAMQRRFKWIEVEANGMKKDGKFNEDHILIQAIRTMFREYSKDLIDSLLESIAQLNGRIEEDPGLGKDYMLGQAYFKSFGDLYEKYRNAGVQDPFFRAKEDIWHYSIKQILAAYCRGRRNKEAFMEECRSAFLGEEAS